MKCKTIYGRSSTTCCNAAQGPAAAPQAKQSAACPCSPCYWFERWKRRQGVKRPIHAAVRPVMPLSPVQLPPILWLVGCESRFCWLERVAFKSFVNAVQPEQVTVCGTRAKQVWGEDGQCCSNSCSSPEVGRDDRLLWWSDCPTCCHTPLGRGTCSALLQSTQCCMVMCACSNALQTSSNMTVGKA